MERNVFKGVNSLKFYNQSILKTLATSICQKSNEMVTTSSARSVETHITAKEEVSIPEDAHIAKYDESVTSGTMFDKCKFSLLIALHIAFKISTKKKGMSSFELS